MIIILSICRDLEGAATTDNHHGVQLHETPGPYSCHVQQPWPVLCSTWTCGSENS